MKYYTSLTLFLTILITLACAKGEDLLDPEYGKHFLTADGSSFPHEVRKTFKPVPGGQLTAGQTDTFTTPNDSSLFSTPLITYTSPVLPNIKTFEIMETEVTIEMYVGYMNTPQLETPTIGGGADGDGAGTDTGDGLGTTTGGASGSGVNARIELFRPIMQDERYCGIYMIDSLGGRIVHPITSFTGFTSKARVTIDPFIQIQSPWNNSNKSSLFHGNSGWDNANQISDQSRHQADSLYKSRRQGHAGGGGGPGGGTGGGNGGGTQESSISFVVAPTRHTYPMVFVSQQEALDFARYLGANYRLPTISEWLYASKGGQQFDFPTGSAITENLANYKGNFAQANRTFPVKSYAPNGYGLYDMAGNVYEATMYEDEDIGGTIPNNGVRYVMGGSYQTTNIALLSTWYAGIPLVDGDSWAADYGFRIIYDATRISSVGEDLEIR